MSIVRHNYVSLDGQQSLAIYSACYYYRYFLSRTWSGTGKRLAFLMLNPSTATERENDPTVERCQSRAMQEGYGALTVVNIFALRATDPSQLHLANNPVGNYNDIYIKFTLSEALKDHADIVCAWGNHGKYMDRSSQIYRLFERYGVSIHALSVTLADEPVHPLYISYNQKPRLVRRHDA